MKKKTFIALFMMALLIATVMVFGQATATAACNNCHSSPMENGKIVMNTDSAAGLGSPLIMSLTTNGKNDMSGTANGPSVEGVTKNFEQAANTRKANKSNLTGNQYMDSSTGSSLRRNGETANILETSNLRRMVNVKKDIGAKAGILEARSRIRAIEKADGGYLSSSGMIT
jgi:hypothetical protein